MAEQQKLGRELYRLGLRLGALGPAAIGSAGGSLAWALARSAGCGVALAGAEAYFHDGSCAAAGVWLGRHYGLASTLFIRQCGDGLRFDIRDGRGIPFQPPETGGAAPFQVKEWEVLVGTDSAWAAGRVGTVCWNGTAAVEGPPALIMALERLGCAVIQNRRWDIPVFRSDEEGFALTIETSGRVFRPQGEDALTAAVDFLAKAQAVPALQPRTELF